MELISQNSFPATIGSRMSQHTTLKNTKRPDGVATYKPSLADAAIDRVVGRSIQDTKSAIDRSVCDTPNCRKCQPVTRVQQGRFSHRGAVIRTPRVTSTDVYSDSE